MNVCDWRDVEPDVLTPLYEHGQQRWLSALGWDASRTWSQLEHARTTWGLPGLLAVDETGHTRGWSFFLPQDNVLHVGGLAAESSQATHALVESLLEVSRESAAAGVSCFMFEEAPDVQQALERHAFDTENFLYLSRSIGHLRSTPPSEYGTPWKPDDVVASAALMHQAYRPQQARHLAPAHTHAAWTRYVRHLVEQTGVGIFNAAASRVVGGSGCMDALVLVTALSSETAHLPQVVVHPSRRGEGLAKRLVIEAATLAARQGYTRATLLVGSTNTIARRLYDDLGFVETARFVAGHKQLG